MTSSKVQKAAVKKERYDKTNRYWEQWAIDPVDNRILMPYCKILLDKVSEE